MWCKHPKYLLDNDLSPDIAGALRLFEFDIQHITEIDDLPANSSDPEIFNWCKSNGRAWITHDIKAKLKHSAELKKSKISALWVRGSLKERASWGYFKIIVKNIDKYHEKLKNSHGAIHYKATRGERGLLYVWAEAASDKPSGNVNS